MRSKKQEMDPPSLGASTGRTMAGVVGNRNAATAGKFHYKLSPLKESVFDTDDGKGYSKVWPTERHVIGKKHTIFLEQNITPIAETTVAGMTGRSKIGSRSEEMISLSKARWQALTQPETFQDYQTNLYLSRSEHPQNFHPTT